MEDQRKTSWNSKLSISIDISKNKIPQAFTIVELIVVITILAILGTIWFVSFSSHLVWTRDTNRLSQLSTMHEWLDVYSTQNELPTPENSVEVRASWSLIWYQWYAWKNVLGMIWYSKWWKDPKDEQYYSYYLTEDKRNFQLMWFLEDESNKQVSLITKTNAIDYTKRYPTVYWKKLGILTESGTNAPIHEVSTIVSSWYLDVATSPNTYTANLTDLEKITWTWTQLVEKAVTLSTSKWFKTCKEIYDNKVITRVVDWVYTIKPEWTEIQVYCDMVTNSWTNTLILDKTYSNLDNYLVWYWDMQTTTISWSLTVLKDFSKYLNNWICYNSSTQVNCWGSNWPQFVSWNWTTWNAMNFDWVDDWINFWNNLEWPWSLTVITLNKRITKDTVNADAIFWNRKRNVDVNQQKWWVQRYYINQDIFWFNICLTNWSTIENRSVIYTTNVWNWIHSIGSFNQNDRTIKLYINGSLKSTTTATLWFNQIVYDSPTPMQVWFNDTNYWYFPWTIDEVRIYNRALSTSEVQWLYNTIK